KWTPGVFPPQPAIWEKMMGVGAGCVGPAAGNVGSRKSRRPFVNDRSVRGANGELDVKSATPVKPLGKPLIRSLINAARCPPASRFTVAGPFPALLPFLSKACKVTVIGVSDGLMTASPVS